MDTEIGCFKKPEVAYPARRLGREFKIRAVRLIKDRGVSVALPARNLDIHENMSRTWVKEFAADPVHAFPGQGQLKPEHLEINRLQREVAKLKAERDIQGETAAYLVR